MELDQAKRIIDSYLETLEKGTEGETILRKASLLLHSKAMIKYAYYLIIEDAVRTKSLSAQRRDEITEAYSKLNSFVDDETAVKYAHIYQDWQEKKSSFSRSKKDENLAKQYLNFAYIVKGSDLVNEINEYILELQKG